jgi:hypothetical protein
MSVTPILYTGAMFKQLRTNPPEVKLYALIKKSKVTRQQIKSFESGGDIKLTTLTKLLTALETLKTNGNENHR